MNINFLNSKSKKGNSVYPISAPRKNLYIFLCWLGILLSVIMIIIKCFNQDQPVWPDVINIPVLLFGLLFFIITNYVISNQAIKHEKTLLWLLLILFGFNYLWSFSKLEYSEQVQYEFRIYLQYLLIIGSILVLPLVRNNIHRHYIDLKKLADDLFTNKSHAQKKKTFISRKSKDSLSTTRSWFTYNNCGLFILLLLVFFLGLGFRLYNLGYLDPAGDEYRHLLAAKHYLADGYYDYPNSNITTGILILTQKLTGSNSLFLLRLPFALIGSLSVLLLFFLGRKLHTTVGLIAAYLYACLPLAVGMSRYIRGYEITVFVLLFLTMLLLQGKFIKNIILRGAIYISLFKLFTIFDEDLRTESTFLLFVMFVGIYMALHFLDRFSQRVRYKYILLVTAFIGGLVALPYLTAFQWEPTPELQYLYIFNFININVMWFLPFVPFLLILIIALIPVIVSHKNNIVLATSFVVIFTMFVYIYFFEAPRRFQVRYLYSLIPYYIILLSAGVYLVINLIKKRVADKPYKNPLIVIIFIAFFLVFNPVLATYYTVTEENGTMNQKNQIPNYDAEALLEYIDSQSIDISKIITTYPMIFDYYYDRDFIFNLNVKQKYIYFPWEYEYYDRTGIYSLPGYWSRGSINIIKSLIENEDIEYLVLHALPNHEDFKYSTDYLPQYIPNIQLEKVISSDKRFGFYIYKVIR